MGNSFQNTHINECMSEQKCCLIGPLSKERQVYPGSDLYNYSPQSYGLLVRGGPPAPKPCPAQTADNVYSVGSENRMRKHT